MNALLRAAQDGSSSAMGELIEQNAALIYSIVKRYLGRGTEAEDLCQIGSMGFVKAVRGYDESFGTQFSTYAVPKIAGEIKRFLRDDGMVKISRGIKENSTKINAARAAVEKREGREARISELCELTGLDAEEIAVCAGVPTQTFSLDAETEDGFSLYETLKSGEDEQKIVEHIALREAISKLGNLQKKVICLRYFRGMTQQETAAALGISQVQVSRTETRACAELKKMLLTEPQAV